MRPYVVSHLNAIATQLHWAEFTSSRGNLAMYRIGRLLIKCNSFAESPNLVQQTGLYSPSLLISCSVTPPPPFPPPPLLARLFLWIPRPIQKPQHCQGLVVDAGLL